MKSIFFVVWVLGTSIAFGTKPRYCSAAFTETFLKALDRNYASQSRLEGTQFQNYDFIWTAESPQMKVAMATTLYGGDSLRLEVFSKSGRSWNHRLFLGGHLFNNSTMKMSATIDIDLEDMRLLRSMLRNADLSSRSQIVSELSKFFGTRAAAQIDQAMMDAVSSSVDEGRPFAFVSRMFADSPLMDQQLRSAYHFLHFEPDTFQNFILSLEDFDRTVDFDWTHYQYLVLLRSAYRNLLHSPFADDQSRAERIARAVMKQPVTREFRMVSTLASLAKIFLRPNLNP